MKILSKSIKQTLDIGKKIAKNLAKGDIICLFGDLGSGKTVLVKGIASGLGIKKEDVISPTFVLIRQHNAKNNIPVYHFDLYRLKGCPDVAALGYEEFFYGGGISLIEWADRLKELMPRECLKIKLAVKGENSRSIEISCQGRRYDKLMEAIT
ncbi:MAG: tRNA (adenosine(37)-N6)-threonylcarbamoyltransferase complex ATPase subunit type 1 TsaE [Candidatus Omnitrophota bacterium]